MGSIGRPAHILKREKTLTIPRHFIFFDTETTQKKHDNGDIEQRFRLGWAVYYCRPYGRHKEVIDWFYFDNIGMFWDYVFNHSLPKQRLWIIARNVVFDFTVCKGWQYLRAEKYKLKFFHNNGVSAIVTVNKGNRSLAFLDSMNWFVESLAATGKRIGIPKMKINFATCTQQELSRYCRNDVLIEFENFRKFIRFLEDNTISRLCYTRASTAMAAYLLRHYHTPIYIHNNTEAIRLERESYKGGRCECFYIGEFEDENYYIVDVNSLYPSVMRNNQYPKKYEKILHNLSIQDGRDILKTRAMVAKVRIETNEPVYAIKRDRTIFPIGTFNTTLCTPELKYAFDHNHIKEIYDCVVYEQAKIFVSYVETFYALRQQFKAGHVAEYEELCKKLLNSLYGKFGQKAENWDKIRECPNEPDHEIMYFCNNPRKIIRQRYLLGSLFELVGYSESFDSFPAIAAHVTAYGRIYLWDLMVLAGVGNYFYCDTDSLIVNGAGLCNLANLMSDTKLGMLKLQEQGRHLIIRGLKDYTTESKSVIKGVRKNAQQLSNNTYEQQSWPTFKGLIRSNDINTYIVKNVTKHLTREYTKGVVNKTGIITPFVFS